MTTTSDGNALRELLKANRVFIRPSPKVHNPAVKRTYLRQVAERTRSTAGTYYEHGRSQFQQLDDASMNDQPMVLMPS